MRFNPNEETAFYQGNQKRLSLLVAIPTFGMVPIEWAVSFTRLQMPVNCNAHSIVVTKQEVGIARNYIVEHLLKMRPRPEYLLFVGDDMLPPWYGVIKLHQEMMKGEFDVIAGLYFIKQKEIPVPIIWRKEVEGYLEPYKHYQPGEVVPVDICGNDFTIFKTEIFEKITYPWFATAFTKIDDVNNMDKSKFKSLVAFTEDVYFCDKAKQLGFKIGVHTGVRVSHLNVKTGEVY